jgi:transcriptional regulator GlxA family with amidase domain
VRSVAILALPGCYFTGAAAVLDLCRLANLYTGVLFAPQDGPRVAMKASLLTRDGGDVRFADGRRMRADGAADGDAAYDVVYLTPFEVESPTALEHRLVGFKKDVCPWLRGQHEAGSRIAAAGAGVLVLAQSGLLDGGEAAEPPEHAALMRRKFPAVRTDAAAAIAHWSGLHTAAVIGAEPSLVVRVLEDAFSRNLGDHLTKLTRISDADFGAETASTTDLSEDDVVRRAQIWLQQRFTHKVTIPELAAAAAVSQKTLTRRFRRQLDMTPQAYLQHLRIETAKRQLLHTERRIDRIAVLVGYSDMSFFREKFYDHTGMAPSAFRAAARAQLRKAQSKRRGAA